MQTVEHVEALPGAMRIRLSKEEIGQIHDAKAFDPLFPNTFLFGNKFNTKLTAADQGNYQMATWIDAPPKQEVSSVLVTSDGELIS